MEDFDIGAEVCPQCSATFYGDMLRDHIVLEHCQEDEIEHNYKVVLAEHSLKSLYYAPKEVKPDRQLRSRKVESVAGPKKSKKRKSSDLDPEQSMMFKMNETIIDEDSMSPEPTSKRRSTSSDELEEESQRNLRSQEKSN